LLCGTWVSYACKQLAASQEGPSICGMLGSLDSGDAISGLSVGCHH